MDLLRKQENESAIFPAEKPTPALPVDAKKAVLEAGKDPAGSVTFDFHAAEFNVTDDLNDFSGNCRFFESLDGIVTADMRHQMERRRDGSNTDSCEEETPLVREAVKSAEPNPVEDLLPITLISAGRTLIIDTDAARAVKCRDILRDRQLECTLVVPGKVPPQSSLSLIDYLTLIEADDIAVTGAFGGFSARVTVEGEQKSLPEQFDLVLDLRPTPSFSGKSLPLGYYAPGEDAGALTEAMAELPEMRGRFQKPRFVAFEKNSCFHGRSRRQDCRRCLDVCPFGAVHTAERKISFDPYLCQGCGGCALVCPADAIRMINPPQEDILASLKLLLAGREKDTALSPALVISESEAVAGLGLGADAGDDDDGTVAFEVDEIGRVGLEMLLSALAYGAGRVVVACGAQNPPQLIEGVEWQTRMARTILKGLYLPEDLIRFAVVPPAGGSSETTDFRARGFPTQPNKSLLPPAFFLPASDRRQGVHLAAGHLYERSGVPEPWVPMPAGSPFGAVAVDDACTLCMACVAACPSGAISTEGDAPRLLFIEARCHQCGLCEDTCPERAIRLLPRMRFGTEPVNSPMVLHEAETFRCVQCGTPFAPKAMVERMTEKLKGHWMYVNERQLHRLQMCRLCRTRDALASEDMKSWSR